MTISDGLKDPICTDAEKACPPEDCGDVWGYSDLPEILKGSSHPEYDEYIEWLPQGFNPDPFLWKPLTKN